MASFALLPIFSGFTFDLPKKHIGFAPITEGDFRAFWSLGTGWGNFVKTESEAMIALYGGSLTLSSLTLGGAGKISAVLVDGKPVAFVQKNNDVSFETVTVADRIQVVFSEA